MTDPTLICGVDIGGSKIACGLFCCEHGTSHKHGEPERIETAEALGEHSKTPNRALADAILTLVVRQLSSLDHVHRTWFKGIGIGCCGIIDQRLGILRNANKLPGVRDLPFAHFVAQRLCQFNLLQKIHIEVENDANAAGLAEALYGSGRGCREVVYLTISTGIGGVLVINGKLHRGATGKAGEFGSLYLGSDVAAADPKREVWSKLAGGKAIGEQALELAKSGKLPRLTRVANNHPMKLDVRLLAECARSGDSDCRSLFDQAGEIIGIGIANLIDLYDPDCVIIGGGMIKAFDLWSPAMFHSLSLRKPSLPTGLIRTAQLGDMVGALGAAAVCWEKLCTFAEDATDEENAEMAEVPARSRNQRRST